MANYPDSMKAAVLHKWGGPENLSIETVPVPEVGADEILIRVHTAGVGVWDPYELSGGFTSMGQEDSFPYIAGSDASGTVVAVGPDVDRFREGDEVYATAFLNSKGGSYAEYAAVPQSRAAAVPRGLDLTQAGPLAVDALTAMAGLNGALSLKEGQKLLVFGASGGVGHLAMQLAKRMGASVFAVASGQDGTELVRRLGADGAADGKTDGAVDAARAFGGDGYDAALFTAGGGDTDAIAGLVRKGGRVAWPYGVEPSPQTPSGVSGTGYNGEGGAKVLEEINRLVESGPFTVHVAKTYPMADIAAALEGLGEHYLGKLAVTVST